MLKSNKEIHIIYLKSYSQNYLKRVFSTIFKKKRNIMKSYQNILT